MVAKASSEYAGAGFDRTVFRDILYSAFGMTDDVVMDRGEAGPRLWTPWKGWDGAAHPSVSIPSSAVSSWPGQQRTAMLGSCWENGTFSFFMRYSFLLVQESSLSSSRQTSQRQLFCPVGVSVAAAVVSWPKGAASLSSFVRWFHRELRSLLGDGLAQAGKSQEGILLQRITLGIEALCAAWKGLGR